MCLSVVERVLANFRWQVDNWFLFLVECFIIHTFYSTHSKSNHFLTEQS